MGIIVSLVAVLAIIAVALAGSQAAGLQYVFGVYLPYAGFTILLVGFILRVLGWAKSPVPFRIPTTPHFSQGHDCYHPFQTSQSFLTIPLLTR